MLLSLNNIYKKFNPSTVNQTVVFEDYNFSVEKGEFVSIVGSNGSGKTTLLNLIGGNIDIDAGRIILNDKDITFQKEYIRSRNIGRVFQDPAKGTAPNMTIAENLSIAENKGNLYNLSIGLNRKNIEHFKYLVSTLNLGLEDKLDVKVGALSGGQRQALALLISTMTPIDLLLLDEHTAALDPKTSESIMELTDKIVKEKNLTTLMITHNLKFAVNYGSRIIMMDKGHSIIDKSGEEKNSVDIKSLLKVFNEISIECGN
jgi:putative ABC transport system ATP-binding protein